VSRVACPLRANRRVRADCRCVPSAKQTPTAHDFTSWSCLLPRCVDSPSTTTHRKRWRNGPALWAIRPRCSCAVTGTTELVHQDWVITVPTCSGAGVSNSNTKDTRCSSKWNICVLMSHNSGSIFFYCWHLTARSVSWERWGWASTLVVSVRALVASLGEIPDDLLKYRRVSEATLLVITLIKISMWYMLLMRVSWMEENNSETSFLYA